MEGLGFTKVSKIVAQNYRAARVFTMYGIDFCCNGGISLEEACQRQGADLSTVIKEVEAALALPGEVDYGGMGLVDLIQHIEQVHHSYVRDTVPSLVNYLAKLCRVHGERHGELFEVQALFEQSAVDLLQHLGKEEQILFPYIQALVASREGQFELSTPHFGHLQNPITMMEAEHEEEGRRFRRMSELTNGFRPPRDACQTYTVAFAVLEEFEADLHKHIHLENNILFPRALEMYQTIFS